MTSKAQRLSGLAKELDALAAASSSTLVVYEYTATANQTVFTGPDNNGLTLNYIPNNALIFYNEGMLQKVVDYTTTSSSVLTLTTGADVGTLIRVYAFGTFAVANVYTKAEIDAKVIDVAHGGTGKTTEFRKGFIDGLKMVYTGRTSLTVSAGAAYIPNIGKIVELTADAALTGLSLSASTHHFVYLYDNAGVGTIEISTVVPVKYYGTAYQKTGDNTRRLIGSFLTNGSSQIWSFRHDLATSEITYTEGSPASVPFLLTNAYTGTVASPQPTNAICPIQTATYIHLTVQSTALTYFALAEQVATPSASSFTVVVGSGTTAYTCLSDAWVPLSRNTATLGQHLIWVQPVASSIVSTFTQGYRFER